MDDQWVHRQTVDRVEHAISSAGVDRYGRRASRHSPCPRDLGEFLAQRVTIGG
jgi:hypothetical protein